MELPVLPWIGAVLARVVGYGEPLLRVPSAICSVLGLALFVSLARAALPEPRLLAVVAVAVDLERQRIGAGEDRHLANPNLDIAGRQLAVDGLDRGQRFTGFRLNQIRQAFGKRRDGRQRIHHFMGEDARHVAPGFQLHGIKLADKWRTSISTFLGMMIHGFPNMLMPSGPQSGSASTNYPRGIETGVNWCTDLLEYMQAKGYTKVEATEAAEQRWTKHVVDMYAMMLMRKAKSWFTGYNSNVPGHEQGRIRYFVYNGGAPKYVATITKVAQSGYEGIVFGSSGEPGRQDISQQRVAV